MSEIRGRPFEAGNKFGRGRPVGSRNNATIAYEKLLDKYAVQIINKAQIMAMQGHFGALQLCFRQLLPPKRARPAKFKLRANLSTAADISLALDGVLRAMASGELPPAQGEALVRGLDMKRTFIGTVDIDQRIRAIDSEMDKDPGNDPRSPGRESTAAECGSKNGTTVCKIETRTKDAALRLVHRGDSDQAGRDAAPGELKEDPGRSPEPTYREDSARKEIDEQGP